MAKDPAFLFYSADFLIGTAFLSNEETGQYIKILCFMHQNGGKLCPDAINEKFPDTSKKVLAKFKRDGDGCYFNERLVKEIEKRKTNALKQKEKIDKYWAGKREKVNNGIYNGNTTVYTDVLPQQVLPLENTNTNEIVLDEDVLLKEPAFEKNLSQFPSYETYQTPLTEIQIGSVKELYKLTKQTDLSSDQVNDFFKVFKVQNLTGKKFYADVGEVFSHFLNWIGKQNINNGTKQNNTGSQTGFNGKPAANAGRTEALKQW